MVIFPHEAGGGTHDEAAKKFFYNKIHLISFEILKLSSIHIEFDFLKFPYMVNSNYSVEPHVAPLTCKQFPNKTI